VLFGSGDVDVTMKNVGMIHQAGERKGGVMSTKSDEVRPGKKAAVSEAGRAKQRPDELRGGDREVSNAQRDEGRLGSSLRRGVVCS